MVGAFPGGLADGDVPVQVVPSTALAAELGGAIDAIDVISEPDTTHLLQWGRSNGFGTIGVSCWLQ